MGEQGNIAITEQKQDTQGKKPFAIHKLILAQDEEVLNEFCCDFTPEQKEALKEGVDKLLQTILR